MRIKIHSEGKTLRFSIPNIMLLNSLTFKLGMKYCEEYSGVSLPKYSPKAFQTVRRELHTMRKRQIPLVEVESADGDIVIIKP